MRARIRFQLIDGQYSDGKLLSKLCRRFLVCDSSGNAGQVVPVGSLVGSLDQCDKQDEPGRRKEIRRVPAELGAVVGKKNGSQGPYRSAVHGISAQRITCKMH